MSTREVALNIDNTWSEISFYSRFRSSSEQFIPSVFHDPDTDSINLNKEIQSNVKDHIFRQTHCSLMIRHEEDVSFCVGTSRFYLYRQSGVFLFLIKEKSFFYTFYVACREFYL